MISSCLYVLRWRAGGKMSQLYWTDTRRDTRLVQYQLFTPEGKTEQVMKSLWQANFKKVMHPPPPPHLLPPGVLWFSVISEFMYIGLLAMGFLLMCVEAMCLCAKKEMGSLKINAYAAMCTILSGDSRPCFLTLTLTTFLLFVFHILPLCAWKRSAKLFTPKWNF